MPDDDSLRTVTGQIIQTNPVKRGLAIRTSEGITEGFTWDPAQDRQFCRLERGWFAKVTLERRGDQWIAIHQEKAPRPAGSRKPADINPMPAYLVLLKKWTDLYIASNPPDGIDFDSGRLAILAAVREDLPEVMRGCGGQA